MEDPNNDSAAIAASQVPDNPKNKKTAVSRNRKLVIFLILVLAFLIPLAGLMILSYVNKTSYIPFP
jgi:hypothetical protein